MQKMPSSFPMLPQMLKHFSNLVEKIVAEHLKQQDIFTEPCSYFHSSIEIDSLRYRKKFWNTQLMSMIIFYVFLAAESDSDIRFPPSRLDFAAHEVTIFRKPIKKFFSRDSGQ